MAAVLRGPKDIDIYLNGVAEEKVSYGGSGGQMVFNSNPMTIGYFASGYQFGTGSVDDLRIYDRELSDGEVLALSEMGE